MRKLFCMALVLITSLVVLSGCGKEKVNGVSAESALKNAKVVETTEAESVKTKPFDASKLNIKLGKQKIKLPCKFEVLEVAGYKRSDDSDGEDVTVKPGESNVSIHLVKGNNDILVYVANHTKKDLKASKCTVEAVVLSSLLGNHEDFEINGVGFKGTRNEVMKAVGTPTEVSETVGTNYEYLNYTFGDSQLHIAFDGNGIHDFAYMYSSEEE